MLIYSLALSRGHIGSVHYEEYLTNSKGTNKEEEDNPPTNNSDATPHLRSYMDAVRGEHSFRNAESRRHSETVQADMKYFLPRFKISFSVPVFTKL